MNMNDSGCQLTARGQDAMARGDLLAVLGAVSLLAAVGLPRLQATSIREDRAICQGNLQMISSSLLAWAMDHQDALPWNVPVARGGANQRTLASEQWRTLSNHLASPGLFTCPSTPRPRVARFAEFRDSNLSYTVGSDSELAQPATVVGSDLDIQGGQQAICLLVGGAEVQSFYGTYGIRQDYASYRWSATNHVQRGNIITADGSVHAVDNYGLSVVLSKATDLGNNSHSLLPK